MIKYISNRHHIPFYKNLEFDWLDYKVAYIYHYKRLMRLIAYLWFMSFILPIVS